MRAQAGSSGASRKVGYGKGGGKGTAAYSLPKHIKKSLKNAAPGPYKALKKTTKKAR